MFINQTLKRVGEKMKKKLLGLVLVAALLGANLSAVKTDKSKKSKKTDKSKKTPLPKESLTGLVNTSGTSNETIIKYIDKDLEKAKKEINQSVLFKVTQDRNYELLEKFLEVCPEKVNVKDAENKTLLMLAIKNAAHDLNDGVLKQKHKNTIEKILNVKALKINARSRKTDVYRVVHEKTALFYTKGNKELITLLVKAGIDINKRNKDGVTYLCRLVKDLNVDEAKTLIEVHNADLNAVDQKGNAILHLAAMIKAPSKEDKEKKKKLITLILNQKNTFLGLNRSFKANLLARNHDGETPLLLAIDARDEDLITRLKALGSESVMAETALEHAVLDSASDHKGRQFIDFLTEKIGHTDRHGNTALLYAIAHNNDNANLLKYLLSRSDAQTMLNKGNNAGLTPAIAAVLIENTTSIKELRRAGAHFDQKDKLGLSANDYFHAGIHLREIILMKKGLLLTNQSLLYSRDKSGEKTFFKEHLNRLLYSSKSSWFSSSSPSPSKNIKIGVAVAAAVFMLGYLATGPEDELVDGKERTFTSRMHGRVTNRLSQLRAHIKNLPENAKRSFETIKEKLVALKDKISGLFKKTEVTHQA